ncbi:prepilin-type N-terminal cleavage/methylation domain-containing protein [Enterococcus phoeniculicola]|nr:prepilin-type N-terminal cleavage/methylation domain-containing protein [Enterococcus phoeniculicola]
MVESLITLFVVTSFTLLPTLSTIRLQDKIEIEQFFASLEKRILASQQAAITGMLPSEMQITDSSIYFRTLVSTGIDWSLLIIPKELVYTGTSKLVFSMNSGNNSSLSKMSFYWKEKKETISYQFQLGSGRYIKKIE